jgi:DNA adenine methylase
MMSTSPSTKKEGLSTSAPLKWYGGKSYLAKQIVGLFPERVKNGNNPDPEDPGWTHYVEPYFGGGAVLFHMDPMGASVVVNDISSQLMNFWRVLQDREQFLQFAAIMETMPFSEVAFEEAWHVCETANNLTHRLTLAEPSLACAVAFFIKYRQSRQAAGKSFATLTKRRTRQGMNEQVSAWLSAVEGLPAAHSHLQQVVIRCDSALQVIESEDTERSLFYMDPPYMAELRMTKKAYDHEMTFAEHARMLEVLANMKGRFVLSGYHSDLYSEYARKHNWRIVEIKIDNKASSAKVKDDKLEVLWTNYGPDGKRL